MAKRIWNLKYVAGNPAIFSRVASCADNPMLRADAIAGAEKIATSGWRVWVEHHQTGRRMFESPPEQQYKATREAKRVTDVTEANVPISPLRAANGKQHEQVFQQHGHASRVGACIQLAGVPWYALYPAVSPAGWLE